MRTWILLLVLAGTRLTAHAEETPVGEIRTAVEQVIPWLEKGSAGSTAHNKCFTCHNHALPVMALAEAEQHGFRVDNDNLNAQVDHTQAHLKRGEKNYLAGKGQGGGVLTAGYALWALESGGIKPNDTTNAVAGYVLQHQNDKDHWTKSGRRPPSDGNEFTATYVALRALDTFSPADQAELKETRFRTVAEWLGKAEPKDTEDAVFELKSLSIIEPDNAAIAAAVEQLLQQQKPDGGWAQTEEMASDAYATGTVMATLLREGLLPPDHAAVQSGVRYLLDTQIDDGTWHVATRADGFQPYYESGFPHGEDQFLSMAASSWATIALLRSLPVAVAEQTAPPQADGN